MDSAEVINEVAGQVKVCEKCNLHLSRKNAVPGEGPAQVELMFIGEGPGFYENEQGRPFVGQAGKFLDELLASAGVTRADVYITNVVKCRPPGNRDPLPDELSACRGYLERQIEALNPTVIVTLGRYSMAHFLPNDRYFDAHPEWFGMRNGKRVKQEFGGSQFCWSNADARKTFIDNAEQFRTTSTQGVSP